LLGLADVLLCHVLSGNCLNPTESILLRKMQQTAKKISFWFTLDILPDVCSVLVLLRGDWARASGPQRSVVVLGCLKSSKS
jgi:hypothetical protein